ncbi:MAG TPA: choice-of-anchor tandem repeat GloVer-containing protein, partial [Chryseolinea sp.]|nr:choice-of-anchor tandem repeat GloVer-containing protein [Chryseolinea sp.]
MKKLLAVLCTLFFAGLLPAQGVYELWGMTYRGGAHNGGVIFRMDSAANNFQLKYEFDADNIGSEAPHVDLAEYNGKFFGTTSRGGDNDAGVIFEWDPATNIYTKKIDMSPANGQYSSGGLTLYNGKFYGTTESGGANDNGVIFEWDPATNIYTKKIEMGEVF